MDEHKIGTVTVNAKVTDQQDNNAAVCDANPSLLDQEEIIAACCERVLEQLASLQSR